MLAATPRLSPDTSAAMQATRVDHGASARAIDDTHHATDGRPG